MHMIFDVNSLTIALEGPVAFDAALKIGLSERNFEPPFLETPDEILFSEAIEGFFPPWCSAAKSVFPWLLDSFYFILPFN